MILSIDPGDSTGFVLWSVRGVVIDRGILSHSDVLRALASKRWYVDKIVMEEWAFRPGQTKGGNKMVSSKVIGAFELYALQEGAEMIFQPPGILHIAELHSGVTMPKNHKISHDVAAYLHGFYYFETVGVLTSRTVE